MTKEKTLVDLLNEQTTFLTTAPCRTKCYGVWYEVVIGIGNDHTASLTIDKDSLMELCNRNNINFEEVTSRKPNY